jgi:hypothetical protein
MARLQLAERWRLAEAQPDEQSDADQDGVHQKGHAPSPTQEFMLGKLRHQCEHGLWGGGAGGMNVNTGDRFQNARHLLAKKGLYRMRCVFS